METTISMALIPINYSEDNPTVLGRDLHKALEIGADYPTWFKRMCEYGFKENVDYTQFIESGELDSNHNRPIRPRTNHQLTLDMAKHLAMIQRTPIGYTIRQYFIEAEKQYRKQTEMMNVQQTYPVTGLRAQAVIAAGHLSHALNVFFDVNPSIAKVHALTMSEKDYDIDLQEEKKLLPPADNPTDLELLTPTNIATQLTKSTGIKHTARWINTYLKEMGLQHKPGKEWTLTEEGKKYGAMYPYENNGHSGFQLKWKVEIVQMIQDYLHQNHDNN